MAYGSEKRKPLSILIGMEASKLRGKDGMAHDEPDGDEGDDEEHHGKEDGVAAAQDMIDAMKNRDAEALNEALARWCEIYGYGDEG